MSSAKKTEISEVKIEDALHEISTLSKNQSGLIINKRSSDNISKILSGENIDIENVASSPENSKEVKSSKATASPETVKNKSNKNTVAAKIK